MTDEAEAGRGAPSGLPVGDLLSSGPITVNLAVPERALAIGAHPDDIEFGAGATLAKWARSGCRVHHLILTDGSKGTWDPDADLAWLIAERKKESRAAAAVIDGPTGSVGQSEDRVFFLDRIDGELVNASNERRQVARIVRSLRPAVVLGHDPWRRYRLHPDHRAAGFLTLDALVAARDHHFLPQLGLAPHRPDAILLFEPDLPNHVEDAAGFQQAKVDALLCHHSQQQSTMGIGLTEPSDSSDPMPQQESAAFAGRVDRQLAEHGSLVGRQWGEAFRLITET